MSDTSCKILLFMKRRPGMTVEAFREYYENHHAPLCAKYAKNLKRYIRRYIDAQPHPETDTSGEPPFDVITELWFDDEASLKALWHTLRRQSCLTESWRMKRSFLTARLFAPPRWWSVSPPRPWVGRRV
jgi:uncharacterized protein (TIGR02118 family)